MNKLRNGIITSLIFILCSSGLYAQKMVNTWGQVSIPRFALSANGGVTFSYTDVKPAKNGYIVGIGGAFLATPYLHINLDAQKGLLKGGEKINNSGIIGFENNFYSGSVIVRFLPLGLLRSDHSIVNFFSGIYGGIGAGMIYNSTKSNAIKSTDFGSLGDYSDFNFVLPFEAGIDIPVADISDSKKILINLNYRVNMCMSDKIDGYVPIVDANKKNDAYNTVTAGIVFRF